jgi:predicted RNA-binding protein with PIN domain
MMRIVIDGYNLLKAIPECRNREGIDPQGARDLLIVQLGRYHWLRGHHITVIFDGWRDGHPLQQHSQSRGVQVIYSQRGEQADDVIRRMASHVAHQGMVVTSDRALAGALERLGADVIDSESFGERLQAALLGAARGKDGDVGEQSMAPQNKKGPSRRPSRAVRQREHKRRNL